MLVLRLQRTGRKNVPTYRLVIAEKSAAVKGKSQEEVGYYLPQRTPHILEFKQERIEYWVKMGAQPSDTVARLLTRAGMKGLEKFIRPYAKKKKKGEAEAAASAPAAAPAPAPQAAPEAKAAESLSAEAPDGGAKVDDNAAKAE